MLRVATGVATGYYFWSTILCENVVYVIIILTVKTYVVKFFSIFSQLHHFGFFYMLIIVAQFLNVAEAFQRILALYKSDLLRPWHVNLAIYN